VLRDARGLVADSLNYGGLVDPWAAEGYQGTSGTGLGGCFAPAPGLANGAGTSDIRLPDGDNTDSNCTDFAGTYDPTPGAGNKPSPPFASLQDAFNNVGISDDTNTSPGNLDGGGSSYSAQALAAARLTPGATIAHDGITFTWPDVQPGTVDNAVAGGQIIDLSGAGTTLGLLGAGDYGAASGTGTISYTDGSTQQFNLTFPDWWANAAPPGGDILATVPYINTPTGQENQGGVSVYYIGIPLQQGKTVKSVTLPNLGLGVAPGETAMHIFAMKIG
jgi:beta-glucosidase